MNEIYEKYRGALPFTLPFDLQSGFCADVPSSKRRLSEIRGIFNDAGKAREILAREDPLVYEFYELGLIEHPGDLSFGTSIVYPGKVGSEYYMTKGHFHTILDTSEVYYCLKGRGCMMMENPEGEWYAQELTPGRALYVAKRFAHRSINVGSEPLVTFFVYRGDAGPDYGTIATKGYRKLIVEKDGKPAVVDNPKWMAQP